MSRPSRLASSTTCTTLRVLVERQGDVELVDPLALDDLAGLGERADERQSAVAEVIAARAVVDEADDLQPEVPVLENAVGHEPAEFAGAGNQHPLQPDAGPPAAFERLPDQLARRERERDVQHEEHRPDELRHLEGAHLLQRVAHVVGLEIQRGPHAEHDGDDAADEHGEEVVHARTAAPKPVEALEVVGEDDEAGHERQHLDVALERRVALRDGQAALEAQHVGQHEGQRGEHRVGHDVEGDEQPVVSLYHEASPAGADIVSSISVRNALAEARAAERLGVPPDGGGVERRAERPRECRPPAPPAISDGTSTPVTPSTTVSSAPPRPSATTGRPQAWASTGTMPKSSSPGSRTTPASR